MESKKQGFGYIHIFIVLILMFGFQYMPTFGEVTPLGMKILGVFFGVVYGWCTIDLILPSLLGLVSLSLLSGMGAIEVFKSAMGDRVTVAFFLFLILAELINKVGLSNYAVNWCLSRKFVQGKPYAILIMLCVAGGIISAFVNVFASMAIMMGVFYNFCNSVGLKKNDKFAQVTLVALMYTGCMAGNLLPFMGTSILIQGIQQQIAGSLPAYIPYTLMQTVLVGIASTVYFLFVMIVLKPETDMVKNYRNEVDTLHMNFQQKFVLVLTTVLLVALFAPGIMPKEWAITGVLKFLDISGMLAIVLIVYFIFNMNRDEKISFGELAKGVNWNVLLMLAAIAPITTAISSEESGIMGTVSTGLQVFAEKMSPMAFIFVALIIGSIITQFANNIAVILMISPLLYTFAVQLDVSADLISILIAFCLNIAFCTPAASASAAMVFSGVPYMNKKAAFLHGSVIFVINLLVTIIGIFIGRLIF